MLKNFIFDFYVYPGSLSFKKNGFLRFGKFYNYVCFLIFLNII